MRPSIFDAATRTDPSPSGNAEPTFEFLNRVAGDYWAQPRDLMQSWADHLANDADYLDLCQRLRSRDDEQFRSAFLELYLHEYLRRSGYAITVHPKVVGTSRRPDFLATKEGFRFYLEAIAPGSTPAAKAAARRRSVMFDAVNRLRDKNFQLWLSDLQEGESSPPAARLRNDLKRWLTELDPDSYGPHYDSLPEFTREYNDWAVTFRAIPRRPERRATEPATTIGVYGHMGANFIDDAPAIKNALSSKDAAYGELGAPFVIAIGTYIFDSDRWHSMNALFGHDAVQIGWTADGREITRSVRQSDGYFGAPGRWQHRNVSAALVINQLMPYYLQRAELTLWRHPAARHPFVDQLKIPCATTIDLEGDRFTETPATTTAASTFGLAEPWPLGSPFPDENDQNYKLRPTRRRKKI